MRRFSFAIGSMLLAAMAASAQDWPKADLFLGYSRFRAMPARSLPAFNADGAIGTLGLNINSHVGFEFEFGGYNNDNINNQQFDTTMFTYLFGPRFALVNRGKRVSPYIHTLFGGVHLTSSVPISVTINPLNGTTTPTLVGASQDAFAMALGGGLDFKISHHFTIRAFQLDYTLTRLEDFGQSGIPSQNRNQDNYRAATGLMFTFGGERPIAPTPPPPPPPPAAPRTRVCPGGTTVGINEDCPLQNISLGLSASAREICPGASVSLTVSGAMPEAGFVQWTVNGEPTSQARTFQFGSTGREPGAYRIGLKATADGYKDVTADTVVTVLGYTPPTGTLSATPAEIYVGERATLIPSFRAGQCGGPLGHVDFTASEGSVTGDQFDSTTVRFGPPDSTEQRKTITFTAKVADAAGSGSAQTSIVVKQAAVNTAKRLPDVLFTQNNDRVNNCGKRVLLEELRNVTASDPNGKVVLVGHSSETERAAGLDARRALNAAAVISAGRDVCTAFPASQILVNTAGASDNGVDYQPQFCGGSTVAAERAGQTVSPTDANAKYRRVEVWYVPTGGSIPGSGSNAKDASTLGVARLGCPR